MSSVFEDIAGSFNTGAKLISLSHGSLSGSCFVISISRRRLGKLVSRKLSHRNISSRKFNLSSKKSVPLKAMPRTNSIFYS